MFNNMIRLEDFKNDRMLDYMNEVIRDIEDFF